MISFVGVTLTTMYLTMSTRRDSDSFPNSIPASSSSHFRCHYILTSGRRVSMNSSRRCTSKLRRNFTQIFASPCLFPRFSSKCLISGFPWMLLDSSSFIIASSGLLLWLEKILISSRPASMHQTWRACQTCRHRFSSNSSNFSASPLLKCSSACRRNFRKTIAGNLSGQAHTQSTWRNNISTSDLFTKSYYAKMVSRPGLLSYLVRFGGERGGYALNEAKHQLLQLWHTLGHQSFCQPKNTFNCLLLEVVEALHDKIVKNVSREVKVVAHNTLQILQNHFAGQHIWRVR